MRIMYLLIAMLGIIVPTFALAQVPLQALGSCLDIEHQTKERLDCYDAKLAPEPKQVSAPAKTVEDCRFYKEQDERLNCFNRFVNAPSKTSTAATAQVSLQMLRTCLTIEDQSKERLDCYDAKIAPEPKQASASTKTVDDCRFVKEQDERLNCYNRFVNAPPTNVSAGPSKKNTAQQKRKKPSG
jgi:uncharacterized protein YciW